MFIQERTPLWRLAAGCVALWGLLLPAPRQAAAQNLLSAEPTGTQYPAEQYYLGLEAYRSGDLSSASELFEAALRSSRRDVNGRWVDSIPSLAMLAECHWQLGSLPTAREHLDHAFQVASRSRGWLGQVDWQSASAAGVQAKPQNLWPAAQAVQVLSLNRRLTYRSGQPLSDARLALGGVIEEPSIRSMDVIEIMRGLALAAYRRRIILGPLAENEPLAASMLESTKIPAGLQAPVPKTLIDSVNAIGYFSSGDDQRSSSSAARSATAGGSVHPLSAIVMLTHGSALAGTDQAADAVPGLIAAVHVAAALDQPELIGEVLQLAAGCAEPQNALEVVRLAKIVSISMQRPSRLAAYHAAIAGADAAVTGGDLQSASELLAQAQAMTAGRDPRLPRLDAYAAYVTARIKAAGGSAIGVGKTTAVDQSLQQLTQFALNNRFRNQALVSMPRVYQLNLIQQAIGNRLSGRSGEALLASFCRNPPIEVWRRDPVDAIAGVVADRSLVHAARVNLAASQGDGERMLVVADGMLANRFNSRLPLGGRLSQIRFLAQRRFIARRRSDQATRPAWPADARFAPRLRRSICRTSNNSVYWNPRHASWGLAASCFRTSCCRF